MPVVSSFLGILSRAVHVLTATGAQCRFEPTCSAYVGQAIQKLGLWRGGWLGFWRLLRCHPWGGMGIDRVPETKG